MDSMHIDSDLFQTARFPLNSSSLAITPLRIHTCRALSALFLSLPLLLTTAEGKMLVGICFFGLTRSLRLTYQSIYGNLLQPLRDAGFEYDIFMHTYLVGTMYNPRSGEVNTTMDYGEWALLSPSSLLIEKQSSVDEKLFVDMEAYTKRGDPWHNNYISLKNLLRQLHSLEMVTQLVTQSRTVYDVLIFARPDVIYFNRINASQIIVRSLSICTSCLCFFLWKDLVGFTTLLSLASLVLYGCCPYIPVSCRSVADFKASRSTSSADILAFSSPLIPPLPPLLRRRFRTPS